MSNKVMAVITGLSLLILAGVAEAKTVRATEMTPAQWTSFQKGELTDVTIEFRQGDELPVTLLAQGDLMETTQTATSYVGIKKSFWIKSQSGKIQISLDGTNFKDIGDVLSGSLEADAGSATSGGIANGINVTFKAFLK